MYGRDSRFERTSQGHTVGFLTPPPQSGVRKANGGAGGGAREGGGRLTDASRAGSGSPGACSAGGAGGWAELLFRISRFLASSPEDLTRRLERVAGWVAEETASACAVWRCQGDEIERVVLAFRDVDEDDRAPPRIESDSHPRSRDPTCPAATAISSMETQLLFGERTDGGAAETGGPSPGRDNGKRGPLRGIVAPLRLGGEGVGALGLFSLAGEPEYTSSHVEFAEDLAGILALAVECGDRDSETQWAGKRIRKIVAHDLRNHLTNLAILFEDGEFVQALGARQKRAAWERARLSYEEIVRLAQDLAAEGGALSVRPGSVEVAPIVAAVREIHMAAASEKGIRLSVDSPSDLPQVRADRGRLVQALSNLVQNGIKFTPDGGEVAIRVREEGGEVRITVSDSGPGIPDEDRVRVFEPGWGGEARRVEETEGSGGIGLTIARECVEAQGGRLWVCANGPGPGEGAALTIALPVAGATDGGLRHPGSSDRSSRQGVGCEAVG